jgi:hypothetical protein
VQIRSALAWQACARCIVFDADIDINTKFAFVSPSVQNIDFRNAGFCRNTQHADPDRQPDGAKPAW